MCVHPAPQNILNIEILSCPHQQPAPMPATDDGDRGRRRTKHAQPVAARRRPPKCVRRIIHRALVPPRHDDRRQPTVRRHVVLFSRRRFGLDKAVTVTADQRLHDRVFGLKGLQQYPARPLGPPRPPRYLMQ